jgi:protein-tyrosine phosphatase
MIDLHCHMQVTSGSLTGRFGDEPRYWGERMLDEGRVHILATDAHGTKSRAPLLAEGRVVAERWVGAEEARHLITTRPLGILRNILPSAVPPVPEGITRKGKRRGLLGRILG